MADQADGGLPWPILYTVIALRKGGSQEAVKIAEMREMFTISSLPTS
jgi:hypothetical protein